MEIVGEKKRKCFSTVVDVVEECKRRKKETTPPPDSVRNNIS